MHGNRRKELIPKISNCIEKLHVYSEKTESQTEKGSLTVWALYAYFSDSQNAAFELLVWCSISAIGESNGMSQLAKYFQNSYALESYGRQKGEGV